MVPTTVPGTDRTPVLSPSIPPDTDIQPCGALAGAAPVPCEACALAPECTLAEARTGDRMVVTAVNDDHARVTALRFGMAEGASVSCVARIPAGPIVLRSGRQEIAVGRELAKRISVRQLEAKAPEREQGPDAAAAESRRR